jgi:hypothetical protein
MDHQILLYLEFLPAIFTFKIGYILLTHSDVIRQREFRAKGATAFITLEVLFGSMRLLIENGNCII